MLLRTPSALFPARPAFSVECPDGWQPIAAPGTELAISHVDGDFIANVTVTVTRGLRGVALDDVAEGYRSTLLADAGSKELGRESRQVLGVPGFRIEATYPHPSSPTGVFQAVHVAVIEHELWADIVAISGMCSLGEAQELVPTIRSILASIAPA